MKLTTFLAALSSCAFVSQAHPSPGTDVDFKDTRNVHQDLLEGSLPVRRGVLDKAQEPAGAHLKRRSPPPRSPSAEGTAIVRWTNGRPDDRVSRPDITRKLEDDCQKALDLYGCKKGDMTYQYDRKPMGMWTPRDSNVKVTNIEPKAKGWAKTMKVYPDASSPAGSPAGSHELLPNVRWAHATYDRTRGDAPPVRPNLPHMKKFWKNRCRKVLEDDLGCERGELTFHRGRNTWLGYQEPRVRVTNLEPKARFGNGWTDTVTVYQDSHKLEPPSGHWLRKWPLGDE